MSSTTEDVSQDEAQQDNSKLLSALQAERKLSAAAKKQTAELQKKLEGFDSEQIEKWRIAADEAENARLSEQERLAKASEAQRAAYQRELSQKTRSLEEQLAAMTQIRDSYSSRVLDSAIRAAAAEAGLIPGAHEDASLQAAKIFSLDDDGQPVARDKDGDIIIGPDGRTPLTVIQWLEQKRDSKGHWFSLSAGGGATSGVKHPGSAKTMKKANWEQLSAQERGAVVRSGVRIT